VRPTILALALPTRTPTGKLELAAGRGVPPEQDHASRSRTRDALEQLLLANRLAALDGCRAATRVGHPSSTSFRDERQGLMLFIPPWRATCDAA
jgi:hypothetical protein